jgi:hypothetical protein
MNLQNNVNQINNIYNHQGHIDEGPDDSKSKSGPNDNRGHNDNRGPNNNSGPNDNRCAVCLKDFESDGTDLFVTACGHRFHGSCMLRWSRTNNANAFTCPMCRTTLIDHQPPEPNQMNHLDFRNVTKKILADILQSMVSHNVPIHSASTLNENALWMLLPWVCQEELTETIANHFFRSLNDPNYHNSLANYSDHSFYRNRQRHSLLSLSDLNFG